MDDWPELDAQLTIMPSPGVLMQELHGESVLLNLDSGTYFSLNEVGTHIWQLITSGGTVDSIFQRTLAEYDVSPDLLQADLRRLLGQLTEHGLVVMAQGTPG